VGKVRGLIIASKAGAPEHPSWFHSARANPDVRFGGQPFRAEVIDDEISRVRLWELADRIFPPFAAHRESAGRSGRTTPSSNSSLPPLMIGATIRPGDLTLIIHEETAPRVIQGAVSSV
jgi:hypothetical protein